MDLPDCWSLALARSRVLSRRPDDRLAALLQPRLKLVGDFLKNFSNRYFNRTNSRQLFDGGSSVRPMSCVPSTRVRGVLAGIKSRPARRGRMSGTGGAQGRHLAPPSCTGSPRPDKEAGARSVGCSSQATAVFNFGRSCAIGCGFAPFGLRTGRLRRVMTNAPHCHIGPYQRLPRRTKTT